jgi:2-methylisocitrate lyase-like PEP mutase family enzyme
MSSLKATNAAAKAFKALHVPGKPVLLANVYDATSARIVGSLPEAQALATASWAIAAANGTSDEELTLATQLAALRPIAEVARALGKPLSVDLQDGYGEELESAVRHVIALGAVGINLEDTDRRRRRRRRSSSSSNSNAPPMDVDVAADRVRRAMAVAAQEGIADFVVNARSDSWWRGGTIEDTVARGRRYLDAGATTVFVLQPRGKGYTPDDVRALVEGLGGKVNVSGEVAAPGQELNGLGVAKLAELGVARLSLGPQLYLIAQQAIKEAAEPYLGCSLGVQPT